MFYIITMFYDLQIINKDVFLLPDTILWTMTDSSWCFVSNDWVSDLRPPSSLIYEFSSLTLGTDISELKHDSRDEAPTDSSQGNCLNFNYFAPIVK